MIPIYKPYLPLRSLKYAHETLDSTWISSFGEYKDKTEELLKNKFGYKHILLVNNGTAGMHLVAKALKLKYPNINKLILPDHVFVAAWNAFLFDSNDWVIDMVRTDPNTLNMDLNDLSTKNIDGNTAIVLVHNVGNIINAVELKNKYPQAVFVEDNCEGFGGMYSGFYAGSKTFCSAISFFGNKNITCGEGGAFITDDEEIFKIIQKMHAHGQTETRYKHDVLGYNYRLTNLQASILYGQLEVYDEIMEKKKTIFSFYDNNFLNYDGISIPSRDPTTKHSLWMYCIKLKKTNIDKMEFFKNKGIDIRPFFYPMNVHAHLKKHVNYKEEVYDAISNETIILPSFPDLSFCELEKIVNTVKEFVDNS
jgi:perosamine synthetase